MDESSDGGFGRAYRALRESEELHRVTLGEISDAVFLTDDAGVFTFICPNANIIFGYVPDEIEALGRIEGLLGPALFEAAELAARGEIRNIERDVTTKSGEQRHLLIHVKNVAIKDSRVLYVCRDITERSRAQEQLRLARLELAHASRLVLAGELTASIAHEVTQPLTAIIANTDAALLMLDSSAKAVTSDVLREILLDIRGEGQMTADIVRRLRTLLRKQPLNRQTIDLSRLADETLQLIRGEIRRRHVTLRTELVPSLPTIDADRVSLQQVLLNLVFNAMEAMDGVAEQDRRLAVTTRQNNGAVEITVDDSGHGIPEERARKLFEPFFTTKRQGIGLGLVIAKSIVEEHGGRIWAADANLGGASFHVSLPWRPAVAQA